MDSSTADWVSRAIAAAVMLILSVIAALVTRSLILGYVTNLVENTKTKWDDYLLERRVFNRLAYLAPAIVIMLLSPAVFEGYPDWINLIEAVLSLYIIIVSLLFIDAFLNAIVDIYRTFPISKEIPIKGFVQVAKIIIFFLGGILIIASLLDQSPIVLLSGVGAFAAVLMLVFKDSILGFVAGIQLVTNKMISRGDWIEMPDYGADGDVLDVTLTTVKVQNWDKTITTIPTYALISDSFKNWRGMSESGGRRIKRSINIDMSSIKFCDDQMLQDFAKIQYISEYIEQKKNEVSEYNRGHDVDESSFANGRHLTNIGTFRAYIIAYLKNHPKIHQEMTFLVRQLPPSAHGLPIEIYVFSNDQDWANYEAIQADIFDHILAVIPEFELRVFQEPTGQDFANIQGRISN
jgi:miniconductance mechanosensitive channel